MKSWMKELPKIVVFYEVMGAFYYDESDTENSEMKFRFCNESEVQSHEIPAYRKRKAYQKAMTNGIHVSLAD